MKHIKLSAIALAVILVFSSFALADGVSLIDMKGREITMGRVPSRIVALSAADCEILYAIGAGETLVGRGEFCDYPEQVKEVPSVQSGYETNLEQIIALQPDAVVMSIMSQTIEHVNMLESVGIRVVTSDAQSIDGIYESIRMLGALTAKTEEAEKCVTDMQTALQTVAAMHTGDKKLSVYFEVSPLEFGLWTAGKGTFMDEIAGILGMENCFSDVNGWAEISEEQVLVRNPDVIVTLTMYSGEGITPVEEILSRPAWSDISAVKNAKVINFQNDELSRPAPSLAEGAKIFAEFVYGADK